MDIDFGVSNGNLTEIWIDGKKTNFMVEKEYRPKKMMWKHELSVLVNDKLVIATYQFFDSEDIGLNQANLLIEGIQLSLESKFNLGSVS